jgi:hypothetical protein
VRVVEGTARLAVHPGYFALLVLIIGDDLLEGDLEK